MRDSAGMSVKKSIAVGIISTLFALSFVGCSAGTPSESAKAPGSLSSSLFFDCVDRIYDLRPYGDHIAVIAWSGGLVIAPATGAIDLSIPFIRDGQHWPFSPIAIVPSSGEKEPLILAMKPLMLVTTEGKEIWRSDIPADDIESVEVADLNGDGSPEFYVQSYRRVVQLNAEGKEVWKADAIYGQGQSVHAIPFAPGKPGLLVTAIRQSTSNLKRILESRDFEGRVVARTADGIDMNWFAAISWPESPCIVAAKGSHFVVLDNSGREILNKSLPISLGTYEIFGIYAASVRFVESEPPYLAVMTRFRSTEGTSRLLSFRRTRS